MTEMVARGHEVFAFAPDFDADTSRLLAGLGIRTVNYTVTRSGINPLKEARVIFELRRLFRELRIELCFSYFIKPVIYGTIAAFLAGVPKRFGLYAGLGVAFVDDGRRSWKRRFLREVISALARFAARRCDRVMVQNPDDMNELVAQRIVEPSRVILVGATGLDLKQWAPTPLPSTHLTFILVARLLWDKGIGEYVAAARLLRAQHPELRFLVLGAIDENPASISLGRMEAWVAEGLIEWPGHVAAGPWLSRSHVFVLPSYREGIPRSTQEAMAMGRPVITTDVPGCRETVVDGQNGFLVPPRDPTALARAMEHFVLNSNDIPRMGAASRKLACERFDVVACNLRLLGSMDL